ncbi:hypothetical protein JTE90_003163 [Oedothorax gibbosus]|uniref:Uncharacterized protein n=1 Tax=Oedothorax gibbosus TaxID=931172 RepID=A0AAV6TK78_9ARAC|nr:hypothetical protein JTE90_003163 [Oedothorax gibbosus]
MPWSIRNIDAIYERPDSHIVVFTGQNYWIHHGNGFTSDSPMPLTSLGLPSELERLDAAFVGPKTDGRTSSVEITIGGSTRQRLRWTLDIHKVSLRGGKD